MTPTRAPRTAAFPHRHLIGIEDLSKGDIETILAHAEGFLDITKSRDTLAGKVVLTLFFEDSTRTKVSFAIAAARLGARVVDWNPETSSLKKGETFGDTILTLGAMRPDAIIIRHKEYNAPRYVANRVACPVVNAGDSWREHPTQALLDALTLKRHFGRLDGLTVAIVGDIAHSRVAASNMILLTKMGASVRIAAPPALLPEKLPAAGIAAFDAVADGLKGADAVMTIRPQKERMEKVLIEDEAYFRDYGMTHEKLAHAKDGSVLLDPGPYLRNVQISDALADDPSRFLYAEQVKNGVAVRMAVLDLLLGDGK